MSRTPKNNTASTQPVDTPGQGMHKGLTSKGDTGFSLFLRKAFIKGAGYTDATLDRPVIARGSRADRVVGTGERGFEERAREGVLPGHGAQGCVG